MDSPFSEIRSPAFAGSFYPGEASVLRTTVAELLENANVHQGQPIALIAPHAGYQYSGPIAASVYRMLEKRKETIKNVILLGPSHRFAFHGLGLPEVKYFQTPLGTIPLNWEILGELAKLPQVMVLNESHLMEHSLEVQLPFLQMILPEFQLVPLTVGITEPAQVSQVLAPFWSQEDCLIVISSDLSHFHPYETACKQDQLTSRAIEELALEKISPEDACGRNALNGLLELARSKGAHARTIDLRNSGDTAGDRQRVVGYGAYIIEA